MAILDNVKTALRISHDKLDAEITRLVETAKADMIRVGVPAGVVTSSGALVNQAIITYCLANMTEEEKLIEGYTRAYELQVDGIRKAITMNGGGADV